ncbi:MAG: hypothetical protein ACTSVM_03950 [Candidatus Ranarchaeia archaeon]
MQARSTLLGSLVGMGLFVSDLKIGWLSNLLGGFPSILVIAFVSGLLSGDIGGGTVSGLASSVGGVAGSIILAPYLFPEWGPPPPDLPGQIMWALGSSIARGGYAVIEGLAALLTALGVILSFLIALILFGLSIIAGIIGGIIGRIIHYFLANKG